MNSRSPKTSQVTRILLALLAVAMLMSLLIGFLILRGIALHIQTPADPSSPLVGTWKTPNQTIQFRGDGTARFRGGANRIHYFEWKFEDGELVHYHEASSQSTAWKSHLECWFLGWDGETVRTRVENLTEDRFELVGPDRTVECIRVSDPELARIRSLIIMPRWRILVRLRLAA